ncbi:MAG: hypothetical protein Q9163_005490 [Psora crenata]
MSASPADHTPGRTPGRTPNGGGPHVMRKPKTVADPLVRPKTKQKRPTSRPHNLKEPKSYQLNGSRLPANGQPQALPQQQGRPTQSLQKPSQGRAENSASGFSSPPVAPFIDYPLIMTKKALLEGYRHHVARFASKKNVDPRNTEEFVRPVRLHRRDPRAPPAGAGAKDEDMTGDCETLDSKEAEREAIVKAEKDARRDAENALVAPATQGSIHKRLGTNLKKTEQVYRNDLTEEQKARTKLRYEEALPWHLEDFENKNTWVGTYEAALSDTYAMFAQGQDGAFRMVPLEKWYKFTQKNQFKTLTIEEAEMRFNKKVKEPRWFMDSEEAKKKRQNDQENQKASRGLFLGKWEKGGGGGGVTAPVTKQENADADDLDFQEDRFADDEENMLFEEDDEGKEAEARIKRDQLQANVFDLKEEKEYEKQEQLERKEKDAERKLGKRVKKALMKREKNYIYDTDSTDNPYTESSESESSSTEAERLRAEEKEKAKASDTPRLTSDKPVDKPKSKSKAASTLASGSSTPSYPTSKSNVPGSLSRTASATNLKRPGSPLASDVSGNESSRKKVKKSKYLHPSSSQPALQPPSRPGFQPIPSSSAPQPSTITATSSKRARAGSGSDSEGAAGSGGDMSDGTRKKMKITLKMGSRDGSPNGSRAGSPVVEAAGGGNRSGSVVCASNVANAPPPATSQQPPRDPEPPLPTADEIRARVPPTGISIQGLLGFFRGRVAGPERNKVFTKLMKENARFDKERRILLPLE